MDPLLALLLPPQRAPAAAAGAKADHHHLYHHQQQQDQQMQQHQEKEQQHHQQHQGSSRLLLLAPTSSACNVLLLGIAVLPVVLSIARQQGSFAPAFAWVLFTAPCCWAGTLARQWVALVALAIMCTSSALLYWAQCTALQPQFVSSLVVLSANFLKPTPTVLLLSLSLAAHMLALHLHPQGHFLAEVPQLLSVACLHNLFTVASLSASGALTSRGALLLLLAGFLLHALNELIGMFTPRTSMQVLASSTGEHIAVGLLAVVALRTLMRESLEGLMRKNNELQVVDMAVQASDTAVVITDQERRIVWLNKAFAELAGCTTERAKGCTIPQILQLDGGCEGIDVLYDACSASKEFQTRRFTGDDITLEVEVSPVPDHLGRGNHITIARDITAVRRMAAATAHAEREALANRIKTETMQALNHELRTPLQGIIGVTSTLLMDTDEGDARHSPLTTVMASSRLLLTLINNMLDLRKMETEGVTDRVTRFELVPTPVDQCVREAIEFCTPFATLNDVSLALDAPLAAPPGALHARANPLRLQQIMINLLSNAIKHTAAGTCVRAAVRLDTRSRTLATARGALCSGRALTDGSSGALESARKDPGDADRLVVVISVTDQGAGLPVDEERHGVFGAFVQMAGGGAAAAKPKDIGQPSGTGLGLSLCARFVERMHGHVWAHNVYDAPVAHAPLDHVDSCAWEAAGAAVERRPMGCVFSVLLAVADGPLPATPAAPVKTFSAPDLRCHSFNTQGSSAPAKVSAARGTRMLGPVPPAPAPGATTAQCDVPAPASALQPLQHHQAPVHRHSGLQAPPADVQSTYRVLIVDDSPINLKVIRHMLTKLGVSCKTCSGGAQALAALAAGAHLPPSQRFNVVLSDVQMPGMDGLQLTAAVLRLPLRPLPLVVGLTADTAMETMARCRGVGMHDVLHKPCSVSQMRAMLAEHAAAARAAAGAP